MLPGRLHGRWLLPAVAGLLLALSYYAPLVIPNLVAFVPLLVWLDRPSSGDRLTRLQGGLVFGLATHLITLYFIVTLLRFTWLAALLYVGLALAFAVRVALVVALAGWIRARTRLGWAWILPACWIPVEWVSSLGDLRMTGDHLAHTFTSYPFLIQFADVVGHYGVGAFLLVVNGLLCDGLFRSRAADRRRSFLALGVLLTIVLGYDLHAWFRAEPDGRDLRVAIVQPDIPLLAKRDDSTDREQWELLAALTRRAAASGAELIVWPETARPSPVYHWLDRPTSFRMPDVQGLAREIGVPLLVGAEYVRIRTRDDYDLFNAALAVDAAGTLSESWAAKVYLVPFAEAVPFARLLGPLVQGRGGAWRFVSGGFTPGPGDARIDVAGTSAGILVCYEQLFPERARELRNAGAEFLAVVTNDAWFGRTEFQEYQADVVRLRAIENRAAFVRASNSGISGFVDRRGLIHGETGLYEQAVTVGEIRLTSEATIYGRIGDSIVAVLGLGLALFVLLARIGRPVVGDGTDLASPGGG